jgi:hypothetical protein
MQGPTTVTVRRMFAVKAVVLGLSEFTRWRIRSLHGEHAKRRAAGELSILDRDLVSLQAGVVLVGAIEVTVVGRWIVTGRGPGPAAVIAFM